MPSMKYQTAEYDEKSVRDMPSSEDIDITAHFEQMDSCLKAGEVKGFNALLKTLADKGVEVPASVSSTNCSRAVGPKPTFAKYTPSWKSGDIVTSKQVAQAMTSVLTEKKVEEKVEEPQKEEPQKEEPQPEEPLTKSQATTEAREEWFAAMSTAKQEQYLALEKEERRLRKAIRSIEQTKAKNCLTPDEEAKIKTLEQKEADLSQIQSEKVGMKKAAKSKKRESGKRKKRSPNHERETAAEQQAKKIADELIREEEQAREAAQKRDTKRATARTARKVGAAAAELQDYTNQYISSDEEENQADMSTQTSINAMTTTFAAPTVIAKVFEDPRDNDGSWSSVRQNTRGKKQRSDRSSPHQQNSVAEYGVECIVTKWVTDRGFGFIKPTEGAYKDATVFAHLKTMGRIPKINTKVVVDIVHGKKGLVASR